MIENRKINEFEDRMIRFIECNTEDVIKKLLIGDFEGADTSMENVLKYEKMIELCRKLKNDHHRKKEMYSSGDVVPGEWSPCATVKFL